MMEDLYDFYQIEDVKACKIIDKGINQTIIVK